MVFDISFSFTLFSLCLPVVARCDFGQWRGLGNGCPRIALVALLMWQVFSTSRTHPDYVT
jgi:hypothetical protein